MIIFLIEFLLSRLLFCSSNLTPPSEVRVGGLFPLFRTSGPAITTGQQRLAGFLLAVKEINEDTTILPNTTFKIVVKDTKLNLGKTFFAALEMSKLAFNGKGVDACIGAQASGESDAAATVLSQYGTVQISYSSTSPLLSNKVNYRYFARTCPSDSFQGTAMASMVADYFGWTKVSTFANSDAYGSNGINQFQSSATALGVQIVSSSLSPVGQTNFAVPIAEAMKAGTRIFVFFMAAVDMGYLLSQGYDAGLFGEGTQIIASDTVASSILWADMPKNRVSTLMKGMLVFTPSADYTTSGGSKFLKTFIGQNNTNKNPLTGLCNNATDDDGGYLYKGNPNPDITKVYNCSGINYRQYKKDGSNLDNYASFSYDATYALARAMHVVLYIQGKPSITGANLYSALINNVSFMGATGLVSFSRPLTSDSTRFAEGDRRTGVSYKILNFLPAAYEREPSGLSGFQTVGSWTQKEGNRMTGTITFNTIDNLAPSDLPMAIRITMHKTQRTILTGFASLLTLTVTFFALTLKCYRGTKLVRLIQFKMQCVMLFGALCAAARVMAGALPVSDASCSTNMWLYHLAFWLIFVPMLLKTWRVYRIVHNRAMKFVTLTESYILKILAAVMVPIIGYMLLMQILPQSTPSAGVFKTQEGYQYFVEDECYRKRNGFEVCLFVLEGTILLITVGFCHATKDVPGALNEATNNLRAIIVVICVAIITFPLICTLPNISGATRQFITSTGIFLSVYSTIVILHGRRAAQLLLNYDIDRDHQLTKKKIAVTPLNSKAEFQRQSSILKMLSENEYGASRQNPFEAVKTKSLISRRQTCREQILHWSKVLRHTEAMMLVQAEDESVAPSASHCAPILVPFTGPPRGISHSSHSSQEKERERESPCRHSYASPVPSPARAPEGSLLRSALSSVIPECASPSREGSMVAVQLRHGITLDVESLSIIEPDDCLRTLESDADESSSPTETATL